AVMPEARAHQRRNREESDESNGVDDQRVVHPVALVLNEACSMPYSALSKTLIESRRGESRRGRRIQGRDEVTRAPPLAFQRSLSLPYHERICFTDRVRQCERRRRMMSMPPRTARIRGRLMTRSVLRSSLRSN